MGYARYVGRVGGLAVALGVGVAVATAPGVAWADTTDSSKDSSASAPSDPKPPSQDSSDSSQPSASSGPGAAADTGGTDGGVDTDAPKDTDTDTAGGGKKSTTTSVVKDKKSGSDRSAAEVAPKKPKKKTVSAPTGGDDTNSDQSVADTGSRVQPKSEPDSDPKPKHSPVVDVAPEPVSLTLTTASVPDPPKVKSAPEPDVTPLESNLLSAVGLAPSADGDAPETPGDAPLLLAGLAAMRRQTQEGLVEDQAMRKTAADPSQTSLMMAAAVANSAPTAAPVVSSPDQATGAVVVSMNATDADGNPLTYAVTGQPTGGSVEVLSDGQFRYTPSVASRLAAASTAAPDFDSFTVTVSDDQGGQTPVTVSVPKLPAVWANQASSSNVTGTNPYGVALVGDLAYVANQGSNTVTVVNTKTGAVVGSPIIVGTAPTGVLANADGSKVYVTNRTSGTVSVINTANRSVTSVKVGTSPEFMALNDTGTRLYVTNYGSSSVSVIDTATNTLVDTNPSTTTVDAIKVGAYPRGIAFTTVNGQQRLYVVSRSGNSVSVVDASTYKLIDANPATTTVDSIKVGSTPEMIAIRDGYAYVTNTGSNTVSVINIVTNKVEGSAISVGTKPAGVALSRDGSVLYVANGNDTVSVINAKTRAVVGTVQIDTTPETNYHIVAVRADGSLVVTDMADKAVRVVQLNRGNTAPVALANPTVGATNQSNGAITGLVNIKDWDGDALTYTAAVAPTKGSLTFDTATGTYTYTPTQAARDAAAQTPATDTFTIRAADPTGAYKDTASVTVQILPTPVTPTIPITSVTPIQVGDSPIGMTAAGNRLYVVNTVANTVSIIDTTNNRVMGVIPATSTPTAVAATADGTRVYVGYYDTVAAVDIDTRTNQVTGVTNIQIPDLCETGECYGSAGGLADVAVSPDGRFVYVARQYYFDNGNPSAISYIDPVSKTVISTGMSYGVVDMDFASDGTTRVYMSDSSYHAILMEDAVTGEFRDMWFNGIDGFWPVSKAVSINPAGTRVYAVAVPSPWDDSGNKVVVYDTDRSSPTYNTHVATITVPDGAQYVEFSADNTRAYVVHSGGKSVTVIDTATNTVIGSINSSQIGGDYAALSIGSNGTLYFSNYANDTVYAVTVGNTAASSAAPQSKMADPSQTSLMMAAAVANSAPTAAPVAGVPDQATGAVVVSLNATDVEGNPLTYAVTSQPTGGTVTVAGPGSYTYTPSVASRLAAASTAAPDFDSFTVTVSDDQGGQTPVTVSVPKLPAVWANQASSSNVTGATPYGVALVGDLAYVANTGTNTVTVVNTKTGATVGSPIVVGSAPSGVVASADGTRVFVSNRSSGTVSVIRTSDNTVVGSVRVGTSPESMALNSDGTRLYVANYGSSNVSVVDVSGGSPVLVTNVSVGANPRGIAFATVNGQSRVYVTRYSSSSVAVIDATTNKQIDVNPATKSTIDSIRVGANPENITISADGTRAYVTNYGSSSVSVINTVTNTVDGSPITVGSKPDGLALSRDGSVLYVANGNDTISVINTKTVAAVGTVQIDSAPETNYHVPVVRSDGALVVTDWADRAVRVVQLNRGNTAPVALANPTVGATDQSNGAITGLVNIKDWDGDALTYTAAAAPTKGSLTFNPAAGTYTYTPTQAARDAAAQTPATDTFTIRATDSYGASVTTAAVTVSILPTPNRAPQAGTPSIDTQNGTTGAISGLLNFTDPEQNPMTYSVPTQPSSGTVTLVGSRYTFTPNQAARDAAAISQGPDAASITVVASDGQLSTPVTFSVPILPPNSPNHAPVHGTPSADTIVNSSGAVSGSLNFVDPDGDPMTYSVPVQPTAGTVTFSGSRYTFTPTAAARAAAAASQGADSATITVVASDGQSSDSVTFTVPIMQSVKTTNQAPWVPGSTIPRTVDPVSGTVTGYVNVQDADGDTLIYTVASPPTQGGTVTFDQRSGYFAYTPSQTARAQAAQTQGLDYDTFSVNITDGTATVNTTVTVQVAAALPPTSPTTNNAVNVGTGPSGVVVLRNNNAYVVNYDSNTVSVIDTATNQVVKTIDVGSGPISVTAVDTTQRQRIYVSNSLSNTVTVIDPNSNTVISTITVPVQDGSYYDAYYDYTFTYPNRVAEVAANANRLYVNATDGTISVFDTTNDGNTLLRTDPLGVYTDLELSPDGTRLYGTQGGSLTAINTATMSATNVTVGPVFTPDGSYQEYTNSVGNVALSPDSKRAYVTYGVTIAQRGVGGQPYGSFFTDSTGSNWMVTGGYSAVAVIDTDPASANYNKQIARILVPLGAQDVVVSGNNLYVANSDNMTVTVIDRTTNMPVGSFSTDQSTGGRSPIVILPDYWTGFVPAFARYITVGPNGSVYVTDYADGTMYAVTIGNPAV